MSNSQMFKLSSTLANNPQNGIFPNFQTVKFSNCQIFKLSNFQTVKFSNCQNFKKAKNTLQQLNCTTLKTVNCQNNTKFNCQTEKT